jgi:ribosome-binding factor A
MVYKRSDRVGDMVREVLCEMLLRDLKDPRLETITITDVVLTQDLKLGTVYFSARGDQAREEAALHGLQSAAGYIRKRLGKELRLRYIPDLSFKVDHSFEYGDKIDRLIDTIKKEKTGEPPEDR